MASAVPAGQPITFGNSGCRATPRDAISADPPLIPPHSTRRPYSKHMQGVTTKCPARAHTSCAHPCSCTVPTSQTCAQHSHASSRPNIHMQKRPDAVPAEPGAADGEKQGGERGSCAALRGGNSHARCGGRLTAFPSCGKKYGTMNLVVHVHLIRQTQRRGDRGAGHQPAMEASVLGGDGREARPARATSVRMAHSSSGTDIHDGPGRLASPTESRHPSLGEKSLCRIRQNCPPSFQNCGRDGQK